MSIFIGLVARFHSEQAVACRPPKL